MAETQDKEATTQIQITVSLANELKSRMRVGDTYEIIIRRLLKVHK